MSENPEETLSHLKEILIFAPFLPIGGGVPFFVGLLGCGLPFLACIRLDSAALGASGISGLWEHSEQVQKGLKWAEKGQKLRFL